MLFDVFETLVQLDPLRRRFIDVGRPGHELELWFARSLRDGMAYTLAGDARPFRESSPGRSWRSRPATR